MSDNTVALSAIALATAATTVLGVILKLVFTKLLAKFDADTESRLVQAKSNTDVATAITEFKEQSTNLGDYIKQHNGRQSEIHAETMEAFKLINAKLALNADVEHESTTALRKAIEEIKNQHVDTQMVKNQIIEGKK